MKFDALKQQLTRHEARRLTPYPDSYGNVTIGIGRNLTANGISDAECDAMFQHDVVEAVRVVRKRVPFDDLGDVRQHVLIDMAFQLGERRFSGFVDLLAAVRVGDFERAACAMLDSVWAKQVPARAAELAAQMRKGGEIA